MTREGVDQNASVGPRGFFLGAIDDGDLVVLRHDGKERNAHHRFHCFRCLHELRHEPLEYRMVRRVTMRREMETRRMRIRTMEYTSEATVVHNDLHVHLPLPSDTITRHHLFHDYGQKSMLVLVHGCVHVQQAKEVPRYVAVVDSGDAMRTIASAIPHAVALLITPPIP